VRLGVNFGFGSAGQLATLTLPSGNLITYQYDANNQVTAVLVNTTVLLNQAVYEPFGPMREWTWGDGTLAVRTRATASADEATLQQRGALARHASATGRAPSGRVLP
jgi:YD repeat-containing protein